jgi:oxygen-independent coproporphyrinogen-3 oxidase
MESPTVIARSEATRQSIACASPSNGLLRSARNDEESLALYIHWPFCVSKCPYCDFNSHVRAEVDQVAWREALLEDLAHEARQTPGLRLGSIFFGGGTPSLMPPATVAALVEAAEAHWGFSPEIEITLEANPSSVESARFQDLAAAGVNRVSLGIQSLDEAALAFLGRAHGVAEALAALDIAQAAFRRVSFDLIYALPGQSQSAWEDELRRALSFGTGHLSLYQLMIEPGTRFAAMAARGELPEPDPDKGASLYELSGALAEAAGLPAYEISNHARPGEESRHNLAYWRYQSYAGIGPGAHGRRSGTFTQRHRKPENWLSAVARNAHGIAAETAIPPADRGVEAVMMGLRLREGVSLARLEAITERPAEALLDWQAIARLQAQGLVQLDREHLRATGSGLLLLDSILPEILL